MTVRLKAIKNMVYAGRRVALGQEFDARGESDAKVLCAIKSAVRVTVTASVLAPKSTPVYQTRMMTAQVPQTVTPKQVMHILHTDVAALDDASPESDQSEDTAKSDPEPASDLDAMDRDALYGLAVSMGLKPHHLMGAAKLRTAIRAAQ